MRETDFCVFVVFCVTLYIFLNTSKIINVLTFIDHKKLNIFLIIFLNKESN